MKRIITKQGHYGVEPDLKGTVIGEPIEFREESWTPVVWDYSPARPSWTRSSSLDEIEDGKAEEPKEESLEK